MKSPTFLFLFACGLIFYTCSREEINYDGTVIAPVAAFTYSNGDCIAPCEVAFTNLSTNATSYEWDFGDGTLKSTEENPIHVFKSHGNYTVKFIVTGHGGSAISSKVISIKTYTFEREFYGSSVSYGFSIQQTIDSGYILLGGVISDIHTSIYPDMYVVKTDIKGSVEWENKFHGINRSEGHSVQQTTDGGYILLGETDNKIHLIKVSNGGSMIWEKIFGIADVNTGWSVQETIGGGYILLATVKNFSEQPDIYLIKTDDMGNVVWDKMFGSTYEDYGYSVQQTVDGGYILLWQSNTGLDSSDLRLRKTDSEGNMIWEKAFSGSQQGYKVQQTIPDEGYIIFGGTESGGADYGSHLLKTNNDGNLMWERFFDGGIGISCQQTSDGGYILLETIGIQLIKTDNEGNAIWKKSFSGADGYSVKQTLDGGYIVLGNTGDHLYLLKTDSDGNIQ